MHVEENTLDSCTRDACIIGVGAHLERRMRPQRFNSHPGSARSHANVRTKGPLATISSSGAFGYLTFATGVRGRVGSECQIRSTRLAYQGVRDVGRAGKTVALICFAIFRNTQATLGDIRSTEPPERPMTVQASNPERFTADHASSDVSRRRLAIGFLNWAHAIDHFVILIYPTVVLELVVVYGRSYFQLIWLSTASFIAFGLFSLPAGWLADRWSRRNMMVAFYLGCGFRCLAPRWRHRSPRLPSLCSPSACLRRSTIRSAPR